SRLDRTLVGRRCPPADRRRPAVAGHGHPTANTSSGRRGGRRPRRGRTPASWPVRLAWPEVIQRREQNRRPARPGGQRPGQHEGSISVPNQPDYLANVPAALRVALAVVLAPFALLFTLGGLSCAVALVALAAQGDWKLLPVLALAGAGNGLVGAGLA